MRTQSLINTVFIKICVRLFFLCYKKTFFFYSSFVDWFYSLYLELAFDISIAVFIMLFLGYILNIEIFAKHWPALFFFSKGQVIYQWNFNLNSLRFVRSSFYDVL